jgi:hypothetical protein
VEDYVPPDGTVKVLKVLVAQKCGIPEALFTDHLPKLRVLHQFEEKVP